MGKPQNRVPTYMVVAPTETDLLSVTFPKLLEYVEKGTYRFDKTSMTLYMDDGRIFIGRSAHNPSRLISITANGIWADEAGQYKRAAWRELRPRIESRETYTYTFIIFTTTPNGHNWLYDDIYLRWKEQETWGHQKKKKEFEVIQWSSEENPFFSKDAFERERDLLSDEEFQARYCGSFTKLSGLVYGKFRSNIHVVDKIPTSYDVVIGGIDFSQENGIKAVSVIGIHDGIYYVIDEYKKGNIEYEELADKCLEFTDTYGVAFWYGDPEDRNGMMTLRKLGITPLRNANKEVREGITSVRKLINGTRFFINSSCRETIKEMSVYSYKEQDEGTWNELKPKKGLDHCMDSLRYAVHSYRYTPIDKSNQVKIHLNVNNRDTGYELVELMQTPAYIQDPKNWFRTDAEDTFYDSWNFDE